MSDNTPVETIAIKHTLPLLHDDLKITKHRVKVGGCAATLVYPELSEGLSRIVRQVQQNCASLFISNTFIEVYSL